MLTINAKTMTVLGKAWLIPDGDALYLGNTMWILLFPHAGAFFEPELLEMVNSVADASLRYYADYAILDAKEVFPEDGTYVRSRARKRAEIATRADSSLNAASLREFTGKYSFLLPGISDRQLVDLNAVYEAGKLSTIYEKRRQDESGGTNAALHVYNDGSRIFVLQAPRFSLLSEAGFRFFIDPGYAGGAAPPAGMMMETEAGPVYGFFSASTGSEISQTPDGRDLLSPIELTCWMDTETIQRILQERLSSIFDVDHYERGARLGDLAQDDYSRRLITALRWRGLSDEKIWQLLLDVENIYLPAQHRSLLNASRQLYSQLETTMSKMADQEEMPNWGHWQVEQNARMVKNLCRKFRRLQELLGEEVDTGQLRDLVTLSAEAEAICGS